MDSNFEIKKSSFPCLFILAFGMFSFAFSPLALADDIRFGPYVGLGIAASQIGVTMRPDTSPWVFRIYKSWDGYKREFVGPISETSYNLDVMHLFVSNFALGAGVHYRKEWCERDGDDDGSNSGLLRQEVEWVGLKVFLGGFMPVSTWGLFTFDLVGIAKPLRVVRRRDVLFQKDWDSANEEEDRARLEKKIDEEVADGVTFYPGVNFGLEF